MIPSNSSEDEKLLDRFGPLLFISESSLVYLAANVRQRVSGRIPSSSDKYSYRLNGGYNLIHIIQFGDGVKYVIRIPAAGWGSRWTEHASNAFRSQALTMQFIKKSTIIPVPEVYDFDTTQTNTIGVPYMVMSFVPGRTVLSTWFEKDGPKPLEGRRKNILSSIAETMSQLSKFSFGQIGSLRFNGRTPDDKIEIGPCYDWDEGPFGAGKLGQRLEVHAFGPFRSSKAYMKYYLDHLSDCKESSPLGIGAKRITTMMISLLPTPRQNNEHETFGLSLPDFDAQNIMTDEEGNVTGILDWDLVQTVPRFLGCCRYPEWVTRDWDPIGYDYLQNKDCERASSPEELKRYRKWYEIEIKKCLRGGDARFVAKSHIFEAVAIAATSDESRLEVVRKVLERVFGNVQGFDSLKFIEKVGRGRLEAKDKRRLETGLKALLSMQRKGI